MTTQEERAYGYIPGGTAFVDAPYGNTYAYAYAPANTYSNTIDPYYSSGVYNPQTTPVFPTGSSYVVDGLANNTYLPTTLSGGGGTDAIYVPVSSSNPQESLTGQPTNVSTYIPPTPTDPAYWTTSYVPEWNAMYTPGVTYQSPKFIPALPGTYASQSTVATTPGYDLTPQAAYVPSQSTTAPGYAFSPSTYYGGNTYAAAAAPPCANPYYEGQQTMASPYPTMVVPQPSQQQQYAVGPYAPPQVSYRVKELRSKKKRYLCC